MNLPLSFLWEIGDPGKLGASIRHRLLNNIYDGKNIDFKPFANLKHIPEEFINECFGNLCMSLKPEEIEIMILNQLEIERQLKISIGKSIEKIITSRTLNIQLADWEYNHLQRGGIIYRYTGKDKQFKVGVTSHQYDIRGNLPAREQLPPYITGAVSSLNNYECDFSIEIAEIYLEQMTFVDVEGLFPPNEIYHMFSVGLLKNKN